MTKAKSAKTSRTTRAKTSAPKKNPARTKAVTKARAVTKSRAAPAPAPVTKPVKNPADWSGAIREALQRKQAPKTWPGGGNEPWKGVPTRKN